MRLAIQDKIRCKQLNFIDGTPCTVKVVRTVWSGGKDGDHVKVLPITIVYGIAITAMNIIMNIHITSVKCEVFN